MDKSFFYELLPKNKKHLAMPSSSISQNLMEKCQKELHNKIVIMQCAIIAAMDYNDNDGIQWIERDLELSGLMPDIEKNKDADKFFKDNFIKK